MQNVEAGKDVRTSTIERDILWVGARVDAAGNIIDDSTREVVENIVSIFQKLINNFFHLIKIMTLANIL